MKVLDVGTGPVPSITDVIIGEGELWAPYRELQNIIEYSMRSDVSSEVIEELEAVLKQHRPDFISLLTSRSRNATDREELQKAGREGAFFKGHDGRQVLPLILINETLLLSDMFDINEFLALDLLATAECEVDKHPGWGRGLVAVYLYYEGRNSIVQSLLRIIQNVSGRAWLCRLPTKLTNVFQSTVDVVFREDMMDKLIGCLEKNVAKPQLELLDSNLALGDWRHRSEVIGYVHSIREGLAHIIFCWSAQRGISWNDTLRLLEYLKKRMTMREDFKMEKEDVLILTSVLYAMDHSMSLPDVDLNFISQLRRYVSDNENAMEGRNTFQRGELLDLIKLNYYTSVYRMVSETHINSIQGNPAFSVDPINDLLKDDEEFEFKKDLFAFLKNYIFTDPALFTNNNHLMRRYHSLFVDFITYMPLKLKEMKNRSEDSAKTAHLYYEQGISRPSNLPQDYENFLECLGVFYSHDTMQLATDFFSTDAQMVSLNKFVRTSCMDPSSLFISNVKMLTGISNSCPSGVFDLVKQNGHSISFEHFFESIMKYLSNMGNQISFNGPSVYACDAFQRVVMDSVKLSINPTEVNSICSYLDLVEVLCRKSDAVKSIFTTTKQQWMRVCLHMGKLRAVPMEVRAKMLLAVSSMIPTGNVSQEVVNTIWEMFYSTRLIDQGTGDLRDELEEKETRLESYSLTISMLKLLKALVDTRFPQREFNPLENDLSASFDNGTFDPYVVYIRDAVLLKVGYRCYKDITERWIMATLGINILSGLLDALPSLVVQLLCDSPLLRTCLTILYDCNRVRNMSTGPIVHIDKCSWQCLNLIQRVLQRQSSYLYRRELISGRQGAIVIGLHELIMKIVPETGRPEFLLSVLKFIDRLNPEEHRYAALDIIGIIVSGHSDTDLHIYAAVTSQPTLASILRYTFIQILYDTSVDDLLKSTILQLIRSSVVHPAPNIAFFLLGADKKIEFQNPGVQNFPRTALHAILDNCCVLPDAFLTLLVLMKDPRLWNPLLRYLRTNQFLTKLINGPFPSESDSIESIGYFLKCVAVELKNCHQPGPLALTILGPGCGKFQQILDKVEMDHLAIDVPTLEFFESDQVLKAMKSCEYVDRELKAKIVRVDMLESLLRDEISKLEKSTVLRMRKSVHSEAKAISHFARQLNAIRKKESAKVLMFDGWRQCLEVLILSSSTLAIAGVDFVTSILRVLLIKVVSTQTPSEYFLRLAAETTLTLCAVMNTFGKSVNATTLNVILSYLCKWTSGEQSSAVRALLYACILYLISCFKDAGEINSCGSSLALVVDILCRDSCQSREVGRMQAMYLMGEVVRLTTSKGLGGSDARRFGVSTVHSSLLETFIASKSNSDTNPTRNVTMGRTILDTSDAEPDAFSKFNNTFSSFISEKVLRGIDMAPCNLASQSTIMNYMFARGFLRNLVEALSLVDDSDLVQLFSNQPDKNHMRALYVFEAKMSLLCRFAGTGLRATLLLMDVNVIHKLSDMKVFQFNYFEEEDSHQTRMRMGRPEEFSLSIWRDPMSQTALPPRSSRMECLFVGVLKLFHVMVDSAPKNVMLIEQIWHFLATHDVAVATLINQSIIEKNDERVSTRLMAALMAKIGRKLPACAFNKRNTIFPRLLNILRIQASDSNSSDYRLRIVRDVILFLFNHANNIEAEREERKKKRPRPCRLVLTPRIALDVIAVNPQENLSFGVILKIVRDTAQRIATATMTESIPPKTLRNMITIIETGLALAYFHADIFLRDSELSPSAYVDDQKKFRQDLISNVEDSFVKHVLVAAKLAQQTEFTETMLLRLRRLSHLK